MSRKVSVSYGKTVSMGAQSYEYARFDASLEETFPEEVPRQVALDELMGELNEFIESQVDALKEALDG